MSSAHRSLLIALPLFVAAGCDDAETPEPEPPPPEVVEAPATRPATRPAEPEPIVSFLDYARDADPALEEAEPSDLPVTFEEAAKVAVDDPVYLDPSGNLWITSDRGRDPADLIADGEFLRDNQAFVVTEPVAYARWRAGDDGLPDVELVLERDDGGHDWLHRLGRVSLPDAEYDFAQAVVWDDRLVVPTRGGVAVLTPTGRVEDVAKFLRRMRTVPRDEWPDTSGGVEIRQATLTDDPAAPPAQVRTDGRGLLAWVPWDEGLYSPGGRGVARFLDGEWSILPEQAGWSPRPVHLMPLTDGSVLQLSLQAGGDFDLRTMPLNDLGIERDAIEQAVADLTHPDKAAREAAYAQLAQAGAAVRPVLEDLRDSARGRAQRQIDDLLAAGDSPSLGGIRPEPGPVAVRERLGDGGAVLEFPSGVSLPDVAGVNVLHRPGFVVVRPGRRVGPLADLLQTELLTGDATLAAFADEWVVTRPGEVPGRFGMNHMQPVLDESVTDDAAEWTRFAGIDRTGRWLFRHAEQDGRTLVIDPKLPDPSPRLPTWVVETGELGEAGWDPEGWPTMKLGGAWRLLQEGWEPLPPETPVETREAKAGMWELAVGANGERYYGGLDELRVVRPDGDEVTWPLPPEARGLGDAANVKLAADQHGRIFLFNRPGRVVRIEPASEGGEPYEVVGVFDEQIPSAVPRRVWVDPAGRICAAYFGDTVAVMWPDGQVPEPIRRLMPAQRRGGTTPFGGV